MWSLTPACSVLFLLCSNVWSRSKNLSNLTMALSQYDILLCSEAWVSDLCHIFELLVP